MRAIRASVCSGREPAALHRRLITAPDRGEATVERGRVDVHQRDVEVRVHARHGNAAAHGAGTDDGDALDLGRTGIGREVRDLRDGALGEEGVHQGSGLDLLHLPREDLALAAAPVGEGEGRGRLDRIDDGQRRPHVAMGPPRRVTARGREGGGRLRRVEPVASIARLRARPALVHDLGGERHGFLAQIAIRDAIDEADPEGVGRSDRPAGDAERDRLLDADEAGQPLRAFGARDDAQRHFRHAQAGVGAPRCDSGRPWRAPRRRRAPCRAGPRRRVSTRPRSAPADRGCPEGPPLHRARRPRVRRYPRPPRTCGRRPSRQWPGSPDRGRAGPGPRRAPRRRACSAH